VSELLEPVSVEIREADEEISMRAEVPGFTEQEIEVKVDAYRVFIAGKQEDSSESQEDESVCSERKAKEFLREYRLSAEIDPERVTAELKDGVLDIRLPKCVRSAEVEAESTAA
jgi:HSP20 family protein